LLAKPLLQRAAQRTIAFASATIRTLGKGRTTGILDETIADEKMLRAAPAEADIAPLLSARSTSRPYR